MNNQKIISRLNNLLTRCYDAEAGYKRAADHLKSANMKNYFLELSKQRKEFGWALKNEITRLGGTPDKGGSIEGSLHREWMDMIDDIISRDDEYILEEVQRGENKFIEDYQSVMDEPEISSLTWTLLRNQKNEAKKALDRVEVQEAVMS